jgi:hypothetical protein
MGLNGSPFIILGKKKLDAISRFGEVIGASGKRIGPQCCITHVARLAARKEDQNTSTTEKKRNSSRIVTEREMSRK